MRNPDKRPLRHDEQDVQTLYRHRPCQLGEPDVVADDDSAAKAAVQVEGGKTAALAEVLVLAHRREQVGLVVIGHAVAAAVEDVAGIVDPVFPSVGHASGNDVHVQLAGQEAEDFLRDLPVVVREFRKVLPWEETGVPGLGQDDDLSPSFGSLNNEFRRFSEVGVRVSEHHVHLNACNLHQNLLRACCAGSCR